MHGDQSPKISNYQQQKKQSKQCEIYKQSYSAKPKSALENQQETTIGLTKRKMFESKTEKPEKSSSNWKPSHNNWAAIISKPMEVQDNNQKENKCHYNSKGFLEDSDNSDDDSIFIVDPGWDDYCLNTIKLNRPMDPYLYPKDRRGPYVKLFHISRVSKS